jgi:hypothetical protein
MRQSAARASRCSERRGPSLAPFTFAQIAALLVLAACDRPQPSPAKVEAPPTAESRPASLVSVMERPDERTLRIQLRAPAGHPLYLENCNGAFSWGLEHRPGGDWTRAWTVATDACYSPPLVIAPGETRIFEVGIGVGERIEKDTYRLIVHGLHTSPPSLERAAETEVPGDMRVSEPFPLGPLAGRQ